MEAESESEQPDVVALVSLVVAEEVLSDFKVALACLGLSTDFEGNVEPEALEPAIPLPTNIPAEIQTTVDLARGYIKTVVFGRCAERTVKRDFQLEAWLYNVLLLYHTRSHCSSLWWCGRRIIKA